jgi:hypothetical protein
MPVIVSYFINADTVLTQHLKIKTFSTKFCEEIESFKLKACAYALHKKS